ncbi:hypothetical protein TCAL_01408 [Tigriopus californicus]|uniref:Cwf18 pre-mRNA splicing factor n=1 Tax=Tigriopus californicus TaxID=6832 RepID=A0A553NSD4_TIGCA|nr:coiled-coil domain-containing protein 12-like [Tigriopus californicus]TRY68345.1 hypothetical protein TCAL_01408 [Tigriopus californicus]|eukprot:TCALIF_01408-PA protein Name:"Similar to Ccdc12 Coiled-coil domain-containing protein 12 (Mus musculus)" AED:0.04 eAED:0.04 QI:141/1/1/1/1/0.75/4/2544/166
MSSSSSLSNPVGQLESAALKRKAKLAELRAKKAKTGQSHASQSETSLNQELPKPVFRSYKPNDEGMFEGVLPEAEPAEVTDKVREELDREHEAIQIDKLDFVNLAPRKIDWDLKRDIAPKLEKLERRTQRAIAELIRERLQEEDLANAVTAGASAAQKLAADDEDD